MVDVDTFLTTLYVMVDDFCQIQPARKRPGPEASLSESEVVTLAIFARWGRFASERDFYRYAEAHLTDAFPDLPSRPQFNRLTRSYTGLHRAHGLASGRTHGGRPPSLRSSGLLGDARPRLQAPGRRMARRLRRHRMVQQHRMVRGLQPHRLRRSLRSDHGLLLLCRLHLRSANRRDFLRRESDSKQKAHQRGLGLRRRLCGLRGRQGLSRGPKTTVGGSPTTERGSICPPKSNSRKRSWPKRLRRWVAGIRQIVETAYDKLFNAFGLWRERPHELEGLRARLAARVALHNFCIWLNDRLGRPRLAFADLLGW